MSILKLFNTLTREKRDFVPIDPANIGLYVCGVTPYDDSHIGHARAYVVFDVLYRLLRHLYGENHVTYVRNFTDIADEIIKRAAERNEEPTALAEQYIQSFHADMDALNVLRPNIEPRVSTHLEGMVEMIDELLAKNLAYIAPSGDVMFSVPNFEKNGGHQPFGTLARRTFEKLQARVEGDDEKRDPRDFPVWKANAKSATKLEQAFSPNQLGAKNFDTLGRPGWHIECSVMSKQHLGPTFDIHGGGEDLQFPHHCCEIAQSESLLPAGQPMANVWLHNGFITVNGTKMSKSLGNFTTIKDALQKYSPEAIRLWLLQTHYRKPVDYSDEAMEAARNAYKQFSGLVLHPFSGPVNDQIRQEVNQVTEKSWNEFINALLDDLNTPRALAQVFELLKFSKSISGRTMLEFNLITQKIYDMLTILGMRPNLHEAREYRKEEMSDDEFQLYTQRAAARAAKNFPESDRLRDELKTLGIEVMDGPTGQTWRRL